MKFTRMKVQLKFFTPRVVCSLPTLTDFCMLSVFCSLCVLLGPASQADEGMWLFNNPPVKQLQEKYHFKPTAAWLEPVQKSSVRFDNGGPGPFASSDRLGITNHPLVATFPGYTTPQQNNHPL